MSSLLKLKRRSLVRVISFTAALIIALAGSTIGAYATAHGYRRAIEYNYQRSLSQLAEYVNTLNVSLSKGQYATTTKQIQGLSTKLWQDSGYAKNALAELPVQNSQVSSTSKFLSQVGNFCNTLSNRVAAGGKISDQELETLDKLSGYAENLSKQLRVMVSDLESGRLKIGEVTKVIKDEGVGQKATNIDSGFKEIEAGFSDYPTMIYDGPFSDHILQQKPKFLTDKKTVTVEQALQAAKNATGKTNLKHNGDTSGNLPTYNFTDTTLTAAVTKAGGIVDYFLDSRTIGEAKIKTDDAVKIAEDVMNKMGMPGFKYRYYAINNGVLTVNFAATQDSVVLYPDLVKVGIALDNGNLVSYDAKGYIMNHTTRNLPAVKYSEAQAKDIVSKRLAIQSHSMAVIPTEGLTETYCHEFLCKGDNDEQVLVYVNVVTGMEEQILVLIKDETGVLAM